MKKTESNKIKSLGAKQYFSVIILVILITDLAIFLDIPIIRQILGFLCFTIVPGLLILQILKLNKISFLWKFILSWGLSISFLMFFGLLLNNLSLSFGYETPLATIPLLISFNIASIVLAIIGYKINKNPLLSLPNLNLNRSEKAFLIVPILFPALSIFGMNLMNTTDNNIVLVFLLLLIPIYVVFVCFFNQKFPKGLYPVVIFLISISLLLLASLRSNHLIGFDVHEEYYYFQTTFNNLHWAILRYTPLDACLSISLLPSIYQSFLNVNGEYLFKILSPLLFSVTPLIVFIVSKKYVGELYGFLASIFFMSQRIFLYTTYSPRTNTAILFFALAIMVLLSDRIDAIKKRILFIVFMLCTVVSHYSTAYIFFFIILFSWFSIEILSKIFELKKSISLTIVLLSFAIIFFWYGQVIEGPFLSGVNFMENSIFNMHNFFIVESRCERTEAILGQGVLYRQTPFRIEFAFTWLTFVLIGVGVISMIKNYKGMVSIQEIKQLQDFLKRNFSIEYLVLTLACMGLLVIMVVLPHVSGGYDLQRLYTMTAVVLSAVFVLGGITLSKNLSFIKQTFRKSLSKNHSLNNIGKVLSKTLREKKALAKKQKGGEKGAILKGEENTSEGRAYLIILLVLIPYFMCVTGTMYVIFDVPREMTLNSDGNQYHSLYLHDQGSNSAKWLVKYAELGNQIYTDVSGRSRFRSYGLGPDRNSLIYHEKIKGYIYLSYYNVVNKKLVGGSNMYYNLTEYSDTFAEKYRIYDNGGSEVWG